MIDVDLFSPGSQRPCKRARRKSGADVFLDMVRIGGAGHGLPRHVNLAPGGVILVPEGGAPGLVELFHRAVLFLEEEPEGRGVGLGIEPIDLAVQFVIQLPPDDRRAGRVMRGELFGDPAGKSAVTPGENR